MTRRANLLLGLAAFAPPTAWFVVQQSQGSAVYFACAEAGVPVGVLLGLAGLAACVAAAALGWRQAKAETSPTGRFVVQLTLGLAVIFALANLATIASAALIPPCAR